MSFSTHLCGRIRLTSDDPKITAALKGLLYAFPPPGEEPPISLHLTRLPATDTLAVNGVPWHTVPEACLTAVLESALSDLLVDAFPEAFVLHAALLRNPDGKHVLFAADRAHGKSTLSADLSLNYNWTYGGDDLAFFLPSASHWIPFPKAVCLKAGSLPRFPEAHQATDPLRGDIGFVCPQHTLDAPLPMDDLAAIVFPHFQPDQPPSLSPLSAGIAAGALIQQTIGGLERHPDSLAILEQLAHKPCWQMSHPSTDDAVHLLNERLGS